MLIIVLKIILEIYYMLNEFNYIIQFYNQLFMIKRKGKYIIKEKNIKKI